MAGAYGKSEPQIALRGNGGIADRYHAYSVWLEALWRVLCASDQRRQSLFPRFSGAALPQPAGLRPAVAAGGFVSRAGDAPFARLIPDHAAASLRVCLLSLAA